MKKLYTILAAVLLSATTFAQAPEKMSYQAVLRDSGDALVTNQTVGMQISILQTTATGTAVYVETQTPTSNVNGLVTLEIGTGTTTDNFSVIDWSAGPYFIKTETDLDNNGSYDLTGTSELLSVPYAMYAKTGGNGVTPGGLENQVLTIVGGTPVWSTPFVNTFTFYLDNDGDDFGDINSPIVANFAPLGYVFNSTDCDDTNAAINPGTYEIYGDGIDNNCNGQESEYPSDGFPTYCGFGSCSTTGTIVWDGSAFIDNCFPNDASQEICDGIDNDCDGLVDEGFENVYYADTDGDGFGDINNKIIVSCMASQPAGYVFNSTDCDDTNAAINPGTYEIYGDGIDNNCNGQESEYPSDGFPTYCGFGSCSTTGTIVWDGSAFIDNCFPNDASQEICDGIDNDCDGLVDEGFENVYYADTDGDGFGDINNKIIVSCMASQPAGYVIYNTDCDDTNPSVNPNAIEIADGIDNDCDGQVD